MFKALNLGALDLGEISAERERTELPHYFVKRSQIDSALGGRARLVLGPKGSGKSAIRFAQLEESNHKRHFIDVPIDDFIWRAVRGPEEYPEGAEPLASTERQARKAAWLAIFLANLGIDRMSQLGWQKAMGLRRRLVGAGVIRRLTGWRAKGASLNLKFVAAQFVNGEVDSRAFSDRARRVREGIQAVEGSIGTNCRLVLLIDQLDDFFFHRRPDWDAIGGLFLAVEEMVKLAPSVDIQIFMREDMWTRLFYSGKDKLSDALVGLRWTPQELEDVVGVRIRHAARKADMMPAEWATMDGHEVLGSILPRAVSGVQGRPSTRKFTSDLILARPREVLQFYKAALRSSENKDKVPSEALRKAANEYSEHRYTAVSKAETLGYAPYFATLLQGLKGSNVEMDLPMLQRKVKAVGAKFRKTRRYINCLLEYEVIGRVDERGQSIFYSDDAGVVDYSYSPHTRFRFHPSLRHSMNLKGNYSKTPKVAA